MSAQRARPAHPSTAPRRPDTGGATGTPRSVRTKAYASRPASGSPGSPCAGRRSPITTSPTRPVRPRPAHRHSRQDVAMEPPAVAGFVAAAAPLEWLPTSAPSTRAWTKATNGLDGISLARRAVVGGRDRRVPAPLRADAFERAQGRAAARNNRGRISARAGRATPSGASRKVAATAASSYSWTASNVSVSGRPSSETWTPSPARSTTRSMQHPRPRTCAFDCGSAGKRSLSSS